MTLTGQEMRQLEQAGAALHEKHTSYLAEAIDALARTHTGGDRVVDALELLVGIWKGGFASKTNQKEALNDVGRWLENRVKREPSVTAERLMLELTWLKRFTKKKKPPAAGPVKEIRVNRAFGDDLDRLRALRDRRKKQLDDEQRKERAKPAAPTALPERFAADFVDFGAARQARQNAKKRLKEKKQPKDASLALRPVDDALLPFAEGLYLSTLRTTGFHALFDEIEAQAGRMVVFEVDGWIEEDDRRLARSIVLASVRISAARS